MVTLRLFGPAKDAAGASFVEVEADNVTEVVEWAKRNFGAPFAEVLSRSRIWVNGENCGVDWPLESGDEVAVLPPVSGG